MGKARSNPFLEFDRAFLSYQNGKLATGGAGGTAAGAGGATATGGAGGAAAGGAGGTGAAAAGGVPPGGAATSTAER